MDGVSDKGEDDGHIDVEADVSSGQNTDVACGSSEAPYSAYHSDQTSQEVNGTVCDVDNLKNVQMGGSDYETCSVSLSQSQTVVCGVPTTLCHSEQVAHNVQGQQMEADWLVNSVKIRQNVLNMLDIVSSQLNTTGIKVVEQSDRVIEDVNGGDDSIMESDDPSIVTPHDDGDEISRDGDPLQPRGKYSSRTQTNSDDDPANGGGCRATSDSETNASMDSGQLRDSLRPPDVPVKEEPMEVVEEVQGVAVASVGDYVVPGMLGDNMFIGSDLDMVPCVSQEEVVAECSDSEGQVPLLVSGTFNNFKDAEVTVEINEEEVEILRAGSPVIKQEVYSDESDSRGDYPAQQAQHAMFHAMAPLPRSQEGSSPVSYGNHAHSHGRLVRGIKRDFPYDKHVQGPVRTKAARKITPPSPVKIEPDQKPSCDTSTSKSLQENLRRQELDETFFTCDFCFKLFRRRNALMAHIKLHEALNIGNHSGHVYECTECKKSYSSRYNLNHHLKRCHSERDFKCDRCDEAFSTNADLSRHSRVHRSVKSYKCNRCGKVFQKRKTFTAHVKVHPQVVYECVTCFQKFSWESELVEHNKTHKAPVVDPVAAVDHNGTPSDVNGTVTNNLDSKQFNKIKLDYCYSYINLVKSHFAGNPQVYQTFLNTLKQFKFKSIDIGQFLEQISALFKDHPNLIDGFNTFLPYECKVELPKTSDSEPSLDRSPQLDKKFNPRGELDDSLAYLSRVKERFNDKPNIYSTFTYIIKEYKLNSLQIPEVAARVTTLFKDHPDLILGFNTFLPSNNRISLPYYHSQQEPINNITTPDVKPSVEINKSILHGKPKNRDDTGLVKSRRVSQEPTPCNDSSDTAKRYLPLASKQCDTREQSTFNVHGHSDVTRTDGRVLSTVEESNVPLLIVENGGTHAAVEDVSTVLQVASASNVPRAVPVCPLVNGSTDIIQAVAVVGSVDGHRGPTVPDTETLKSAPIDVENRSVVSTDLSQGSTAVTSFVNGSAEISKEIGCKNVADVVDGAPSLDGVADRGQIRLVAAVVEDHINSNVNVSQEANIAKNVALGVGKCIGPLTNKILIICPKLAHAKMISGARNTNLGDMSSVECASAVVDGNPSSGTSRQDASVSTVTLPHNPSTSSTFVAKKPVSSVSNTNICQPLPNDPRSSISPEVITGTKIYSLNSGGIDSGATSKTLDVASNSLSRAVNADQIRSPHTIDVSTLNVLKEPSSSLLYKQLMSAKGITKRFNEPCNIQSLATFTKIEAPNNDADDKTVAETKVSAPDTDSGNVGQAALKLLTKPNSLPRHNSLSLSNGSRIAVPYVVNCANEIFSVANTVSEGNAGTRGVVDNVAHPKSSFTVTTLNGTVINTGGRAIYTVANNMVTINPTKITLVSNNALKIAANTNSYNGLNIVKNTNIGPCAYTLASTANIASFPAASVSGANPSNRPLILIRTNPVSGPYLLANPGARLALCGKKIFTDYRAPAKEPLNVITNDKPVICETNVVTNSNLNTESYDNYTKRIGVWKNKINRTKRVIGSRMTTMKTYISNKTISICKPSSVENVTASLKINPSLPGIGSTVPVVSSEGMGNTAGTAKNIGSVVQGTSKSPKRRKICPKIKSLNVVKNVCVKTQDHAASNGPQSNRLLLPAGANTSTQFVASSNPNRVVTIPKETMSEASRYFASFSIDQSSSQSPVANEYVVASVDDVGTVQDDPEDVTNRSSTTKAARKQCLESKSDAVEDNSGTVEEPCGDDNKSLLGCETFPKTYSRKDSLANHMVKTHLSNKQSS